MGKGLLLLFQSRALTGDGQIQGFDLFQQRCLLLLCCFGRLEGIGSGRAVVFCCFELLLQGREGLFVLCDAFIEGLKLTGGVL